MNVRRGYIKDWQIGLITVVVVLSVVVLFMGPSRMYLGFRNWFTTSYGADWLVVQYAQNGSIIKHWRLIGKTIKSEDNSDGIYFTDQKGNVVHMSGHYIYVQIGSDWKELAQEYKIPDEN